MMKGKKISEENASAMKRHRLKAAVLPVAVVAIFLPSVFGEFLNWDDDRFVVNNPKVSALTVDNIREAFSGLTFESYQPLHLLSYMIDGTLWKGSAPMYRLHNLFLVLAGILLLYALLLRFGFSPKSSLVGTLFFALAPYRVESFAWIAARKDCLMLVFVFVAWHIHLLADDRPAHSKKLRIASLLVFILALLSKSSALVFPAMMLAADIGMGRKTVKSAAFTSAIFFIPAAAVAGVLPFIWSDASLVQQAPLSAGGRVALVGWTFFRYVKTVLWPFSTSPLYAAPDEDAVTMGALAAAGIAGLAVALFVYFHKKKISFRKLATSLALFILALAPFLNVVPLYYYQADRYLLLPSVGLALGCAAIAERAGQDRRMKPVMIFTVLFIIAMGAASMYESYCWRDSVHLWRHAVTREPNSYFARLKLGETLRNADRYEESMRQYRAALKIRPLLPSATGGLFFSAILADMSDSGSLDRALAEKTAFHFVSIANDGSKLNSLLRYLDERQWRRAEAVVRERFQP